MSCACLLGMYPNTVVCLKQTNKNAGKISKILGFSMKKFIDRSNRG